MDVVCEARVATSVPAAIAALERAVWDACGALGLRSSAASVHLAAGNAVSQFVRGEIAAAKAMGGSGQ